MYKQTTNEQMIKKLVGQLHPVEVVILRECILKIMDLTLQDIAHDPKPYSNPLIHTSAYIHLAQQVYEVIGFEHDNSLTPEQQEAIDKATVKVDEADAERRESDK